jgi:hypothetical protein
MRAVNMDGTPNPLIPAHVDDLPPHGRHLRRLRQALEAGAAPVVDPMAVGPLGQMAVITDPTGAGVGCGSRESSPASTRP